MHIDDPDVDFDELEDEDWKGRYLGDEYADFCAHLKKQGFTYLNEGSFRRVYERRNIVVKVPMFEDGIIDNMVEHRAYHTYFNGPTRRGIYLAPCRLLPNKCLMMRKVYWNVRESHNPKWKSEIDRGQVGFYNGRMVAYDFAIDLTERFKWEKEWDMFSLYFNSNYHRNQNHYINKYLTQKERRARLAAR